MKKRLTIMVVAGLAMLCANNVFAQEDAVYEDITIKKKTYHIGISGAVDLGLSVMWATHNVGAEKPYEDGEHYAWAECEDKSESFYDWRSYQDLIDGQLYHFKKYREGKTKQITEDDDVAHVKMGGRWRMPTMEETEELMFKCKWKWIKYNGREGFVVIGKTGNAIFMPAAGVYTNTYLNDWDSGAQYWSSTRADLSATLAYVISFNAGGPRKFYQVRYAGLSVRGVCPKE